MTPARPTLAHFTRHGRKRGGVRVVDDLAQGYVIVQWAHSGARRVKCFPRTPEGRREALAFAEGVWEQLRQPPTKLHLTIRQVWERFLAGIWHSLRPLTQRNYRAHWTKWELFASRDRPAEDLSEADVDAFVLALRRQGIGVGQIQRTVGTIKRVFRWAASKEHIQRNRLADYRLAIGKEERPIPPAEYSMRERDALVEVLARRRDRSDGWRPWAIVLLAAHQGKREHQLLHLQVDDLDLRRGRILWRSAWEKSGKELWQPLTDAGYSAVLTALRWRQADEYTGPWLFYSAHSRKQALGGDARAVYHKASLWLALVKAEAIAGIAHRSRRAMHGFRRGVAGDVLAATRDVKLALDWIGDSDLKQAKSYLAVRDERLDEAAAVMDRHPKPSTIRQWSDESDDGELVGAGAATDCETGPAGLEPATPGFGDRCSTN